MLNFDDVWRWYHSAHAKVATVYAEAAEKRRRAGYWRRAAGTAGAKPPKGGSKAARAELGGDYRFGPTGIAREMFHVDARYETRDAVRKTFSQAKCLSDVPLPQSDEQTGLF